MKGSLYNAEKLDTRKEEERYLGQDPELSFDHLCYWLEIDAFRISVYSTIGALFYRLGNTDYANLYINNKQAFLIGTHNDSNESIRETLDKYSLSYDELVGLSEFQDELHRPLSYPEIPASDLELIKREGEWFAIHKSQPCLDFEMRRLTWNYLYRGVNDDQFMDVLLWQN